MAEKNITQKALAAHCDVDQGTVSRWLDGTLPSRPTLDKIAEMVGTTVEWLLVGDAVPVAAAIVQETAPQYGLPPLTRKELARVLETSVRELQKWYGATVQPTPNEWNDWFNDRPLPEYLVRLYRAEQRVKDQNTEEREHRRVAKAERDRKKRATKEVGKQAAERDVAAQRRQRKRPTG